MTQHNSTEAVLAAPPLSVGALTLWGVPLSEWVLVLTALYTIFLLIDKLPAVWARLRAFYRCLKELHGRN